jgi:hypothetical protein
MASCPERPRCCLQVGEVCEGSPMGVLNRQLLLDLDAPAVTWRPAAEAAACSQGGEQVTELVVDGHGPQPPARPGPRRPPAIGPTCGRPTGISGATERRCAVGVGSRWPRRRSSARSPGCGCGLINRPRWSLSQKHLTVVASAHQYDGYTMRLISLLKNPNRDAAYCRCGHPRAAHEHYRRGLECSLCDRGACPRYRRSWRLWSFARRRVR